MNRKKKEQTKDNQMNPSFVDESYWSKAWVRHIENYLISPSRCGYWIRFKFSKVKSILEIAGGSCRDSLYLSSFYNNVIGSDFDEKTLSYLQQRFPESKSNFSRQDAFNFDYKDNTFELSFSNGFWVLFNDNSKLVNLFIEQTRVSKKYVVNLVHNADNKRLVKVFQDKSKQDSLYNIRFFRKNELLDIVNNSGVKYKSLRLKKFGGPFDIFLSNKCLNKIGFVSDMLKFLIPALYCIQPWSKVERIALIVEL